MSNKTPKKPLEETESAHSTYIPRFTNNFLYFVLGFLILLVIGSIVFYSTRKSTYSLLVPSGSRIAIELADSKEERVHGLSGRELLNGGLLFVFDASSKQNCFWMKDMRFSIDMVWLDENKKVVTVADNVSPETYPETFCPETPAVYGLEINANQAEHLGIKPGVVLKF